MKILRLPILLAVMAALAPHGHGASIVVSNSTFDFPEVADQGTSFGNPPGWTLSGAAPGALNTTVKDRTNIVSLQDGQQFGGIYVDNNDGLPGTPNGGTGMLTSAVVTNFQANTTYTLSIAAAKGGGASGLTAGLALLAGGTNAALFTIDFDLLSDRGDFAGAPAFTNLMTLTFDTSLNPSVVGQDLQIGIFLVNESFDFGRDLLFDNVQLDAVVIPEPSVIALLASGAVALLLGRRRFR